jgi:hypothetical protein
MEKNEKCHNFHFNEPHHRLSFMPRLRVESLRTKHADACSHETKMEEAHTSGGCSDWKE